VTGWLRPLRFVGLDLSMVATAIAATHDPQGRPFLSVFTVPGTAGLGLHEQIARIERAVRSSCGGGHARLNPDSPDLPDLVVIEGTFSRSGAHASDYPLHALHANVKQWLWRHRIPYVNAAPATLKVWTTGNGAATKRQVIEHVVADYGRHLTIPPNDDKACDAVGLLSMGLAKYGQPLNETPPPGRRALKSVNWPSLNLSGVPA
jgi:crossover junction endodeoxyribonuclease RuvC